MVCWRGDRKPDNGLRQYFIFKIFLRQWLTKTIFAYITCVQIIKSASFVGRFKAFENPQNRHVTM